MLSAKVGVTSDMNFYKLKKQLNGKCYLATINI